MRPAHHPPTVLIVNAHVQDIGIAQPVEGKWGKLSALGIEVVKSSLLGCNDNLVIGRNGVLIYAVNLGKSLKVVLTNVPMGNAEIGVEPEVSV